MNEHANRHKRSVKRFIINPAVQWHYTATAIVGVFVVSAFVAVLLYGVLFDQARSRALFMPSASALDVGVSVIAAAVAFAAVPAIACGLWAIVMTHRLCGPVRVIENHLRELENGRFPKHRPLRKKDAFRDVYGGFWRAIDKLKGIQVEQFHALCRLRDEANEVAEGREDARQAAARFATELQALCRDASDRLGINDEHEAGTEVHASQAHSGVRQFAEMAS